MLGKISKYHNSLVGLFIRELLIFSILIILLIASLEFYTSQVYLRSFPSIDDILVYEDELREDNYDLIPRFKLRGANFTILDEDLEVIYTSMYHDNLKKDEVKFIPNYDNYSYIEVLHDNDNILILQRLIEDYSTIVSYVTLDKDLRRVEGDLFEGKDVFTNEEISLLTGLVDDKNIIKYRYITNYGSLRTLVYYYDFVNENYLNTLNIINNLKFLIVLVTALVLMVIQSISFKRKIVKKMKPLNEAIESYKEGKLAIDYNATLNEAKTILDSFSDLANKLNKSNEEKQKYYDDRERIVADISHDLKTPLTVIQGYAKALNDNIVPSEKQAYYLSAIYEKSVVANEVLNSFFEFTKLGHADYVLNLEKTDLVEYTKQYIISIYNSVISNNFDFVLDLEGEVEVMLDKALFKRVYQNLINNALKYSKGDTIYVRVSEDNDYAYLEIGDNGIGISDNLKSNLFEPFVTSNAARVSGEGTGLGLSIVKKIICLHEGSIILTSDTIYTTLFKIKLKKS